MASLMNENNNSQSWSNNSSGIQENNNENENTAMNDSNDDNNNNNNDNVTNTQQPVRKRTRATADQLSVLEDTFAVNVSPNSKLRKQLAEQLQMSERSIQIWFQNRRAKVKHMQKRAQMQMHQASIRAQLYQYHQQQQQQGYAQPMNYYYNPVTAVNYHHHHPSRILNAIPRAQSVDAIQHYHRQQQLFVPPPPPPPGISPSNYNPTMFYPAMDMSPISRQSMPPYDLNDIGLEFPEYLNGPSPSPSPIQPMKPSTIPTLIPVPDAGPTAVLATTTTTNTNTNTTTKINNKNNDIANKRTSSVEDTWISSPDSSNNNDDKNNKNATSTDSSTVDPSNLVITGKEQSTIVIEGDEEEEPKDLYLSATTLTIGTWHRLRMSETDLVCVYRPDTRTFAWHIVDGGCHFKMEVTQDAVSSIEYIVNGEHDALAEVHFDISEPPLFYMESTTVNTTIEEDPQDKKKRKASNASIITPVWVQCSDFTEGKQASRFFRHTLKGVQHHLKQELLALIQNHEETRRLVHFIEPPAPSAATAATAANIYPMDYSTDITGYLNPGVYWNNGGGIPITTSAGNTNGGTSTNNDLLSCGLYIS